MRAGPFGVCPSFNLEEKTIMKRLSLVLLVSATALALGCASTSKSASASGMPANKVCVVVPDHPVKEKNPTTVQWKGKTVGFCCPDCIEDWNAMSEGEKEKAYAAAMAAK